MKLKNNLWWAVVWANGEVFSISERWDDASVKARINATDGAKVIRIKIVPVKTKEKK